uniref:Uncharacterized protein n=1 Tax=Steinernema glaseri TaxID=37863 RepID=A0A1I7Y3H0_9BILA
MGTLEKGVSAIGSLVTTYLSRAEPSDCLDLRVDGVDYDDNDDDDGGCVHGCGGGAAAVYMMKKEECWCCCCWSTDQCSRRRVAEGRLFVAAAAAPVIEGLRTRLRGSRRTSGVTRRACAAAEGKPDFM